MKFCSHELGSKLKKSLEKISEYVELEYLSNKSSEVINEVNWDDVYEIIKTTGLATSDAMILNMFKNTNIPYLFTTDFDIIYAISTLPVEKYIFCPEKLYEKYKKHCHVL